MRAGKVTLFVFIRNIAGEDDILPPMPLDKLLKTTSQATFSYKKKTCVRMPLTNVWDGTQQIFRTFTLLETTHEEDIPFTIHVLWERCNFGTQVIKIDAIWDDTIVSGEVARDELASGGGNGDATGQASKKGPQEWIGRGICEVGSGVQMRIR